MSANDDFKKFVKKVEAAQALNEKTKSELVDMLSRPLDPSRRSEMNEALVVTCATISATQDIIKWPEQQKANLESGRKELPGIKSRIKELTEEN